MRKRARRYPITEALLAAGMVAAALLSACGQRGPLYLPERNARVVTRPAGPAASSAPNSAPDSAPAPATPDQK